MYVNRVLQAFLKLFKNRNVVLVFLTVIVILFFVLGYFQHDVSEKIFHKWNSNSTAPHKQLPYSGDNSYITDCPSVRFLANTDPTAKNYYPDVICKNEKFPTDTLCRIHLRQNGLEHLAKETCMMDNTDKVPKIVYFVIFGNYSFRFLHYVSVVAAKRFVKPRAIYVIGDKHPTGFWWQNLLKTVHGIRFVYREAPTNISGKPVKFPHHYSDMVRLQTLYVNGGIYLDADMVVVRDLDPLLDYDITLGKVDGAHMGNGFIVAKRGSEFIREWIEQYNIFKNQNFFWNSMVVGKRLWDKNKTRVHLETSRLYVPSFNEVGRLYKFPDDRWRKSYGVHFWTNGWKNPVPKTPEEIQMSNSTAAQIFRSVLYGDWRQRNITKKMDVGQDKVFK